MLRPLYSCWKVDDEGRPILDRDGERIRDKRGGTVKAKKDLTKAEKQSMDDQQRHFDARMKWQAAQLLRPIEEAKRLLATS